ncbi:phosphonate ABC transporter, permease protein PhnE [Neobacillus mesonae]|uniref:phosphonate ABC transporter, permease protein PhnE n=1 Tax=Neobacillus mesonae TaxID=1193713 RepID=UPI0020416C85|nr:phosphonate ABC transporter, permease protein PhnE [Neobacillus mesonae]MCM3570910.1 phosphonate ABC transporter, permease protein PhnE [Neobacillus mesonae]
MSETTRIIPKPKKNKIGLWFIYSALLLIYIWAFSGMGLPEIKQTAGQISKAIFSGIFHPDWNYISEPGGEDLLHGLLDTLAIAILGTFISAFLCIPFAFWSAANMSKGRAIPSFGKFALSFIRTFPELVMAIMFIKAVGPGSFAGVLALGLHSIGMLGKLFSEEIENMDSGPTEALIATGANRIQTLWFAIIPQVIPGFLSYTLYRFEINVRSATILGVIGAGGIGTPLIFALTSRDWNRVGIILIGIIVMVTMIDLISGYLRKKFI